jgi:ribonucleoside-diphosphate reductase alpha chain
MKKDKYSPIAMDVLKMRYLKDNEDPSGMFMRVASWVAQAEGALRGEWKDKFFELMDNHDFLPNSPCLMNAGTSLPQLAACFVYPIDDDLESIFDTLKLAAMTHKSGGGTGFSFSRLRPGGDKVGMTNGVTSGPVSFLEVYNRATESIKQGGKRRGANMAMLRVDHPDIEQFIDAKQEDGKLSNFNMSVAVTDDFMEALRNKENYNLYFPPGIKYRGEKNAKKIFEKISHGAWRNGEPGVIFIDKINNKNPLKEVGEIEAVNPCGEQPLLPYEACILGSINLANHEKDGNIDWGKLKDTVALAVRFLDDAIDVSEYPAKEVAEIVKKNRKIGLGVMGFATLLMKLGIPYSSIEGIKTGQKLMKFIKDASHEISAKLAIEKGEFLNFYKSSLKVKRRNSFVTTIAPTGTISLIAGVSSGIEPVYSLLTERRLETGNTYVMVDPVFNEQLKDKNIFPEKIIDDIKEKGGIKELDYIPEEIRQIFLTATEIEPRMHVLMQAAFQKYVDNAISKTINLPEDYSIDEVKDIILTAYRTGCKGITLYRQQTRKQQVLSIVCEECEGLV